MPSRPAPIVAAAAAVLALCPAGARADPAPVRFDWVRGRGADACPSRREVADQVAARLGKSPFVEDAARSIDAYVTRSDQGWRAEIDVRDEHGAPAGVRELTSEAPDCAPIASACVLAIALAIDPDAATRPPPPSPAPSPAPPAPPPPAGEIPPPARPPAPVPPPLPWLQPSPPAVTASPAPPPAGIGGSSVALRAGAGLGLLPGPGVAISLAGAVAVGRSAQITGEAIYLPEARTSDGDFAFGLTALSIGACGTVVRGAWADLGACGALWVGALHAVVYHLEPTNPGDWAWAAASATPRLRIRLASRLHLELATHVIVPFVRRAFTATGRAAPVFQEAPLTAVPLAGLGTTFP
jgi:hypothetical protein